MLLQIYKKTHKKTNKKRKRNDLQNTAQKDKYWASRTPLMKGMNSSAEG